MWAAPSVAVQLRDTVERVTIGGETYAAGAGVRRLVTVDDGAWAAEVWLGGTPWARVATVDASGALRPARCRRHHRRARWSGRRCPPRCAPRSPSWWRTSCHRRWPPVPPPCCAELAVEWGDAGAAAARDRGDRVVVHAALWDRLAPRGLGEVALALAEALAPPVAIRAQARLAAALR